MTARAVTRTSPRRSAEIDNKTTYTMGNFYTNYTLKGPGQDEIVEALTDRNAVISPERDGCVVVYDQESDDQDLEVISRLASRLSGKPEYVRF